MARLPSKKALTSPQITIMITFKTSPQGKMDKVSNALSMQDQLSP